MNIRTGLENDTPMITPSRFESPMAARHRRTPTPDFCIEPAQPGGLDPFGDDLPSPSGNPIDRIVALVRGRLGKSAGAITDDQIRVEAEKLIASGLALKAKPGSKKTKVLRSTFPGGSRVEIIEV